MITTDCSTETTQHEQIAAALATAIEHGMVVWDPRVEWDSEDPDYEALTELSPHRAALRRLGIVFPTKARYRDRLEVVPQGAETWAVHNLTKGTEYTVTTKGLRLDCTCDQYGNGFCKHREAVEDWRDEHGRAVVPPAWVDDTDPQSAMLEVMGVIATPPARTYDFTPHWTVPFPPSDEQSAALQAMAAWYDSQDPIFRLTGYAGTGKSTAIQAFIKYLQALTLPPRIAVAAPINKAVKVQQRILRAWGLGSIPTHTCAQLFGVKRKVIDGVEEFSVDPDAYPYYKDYNIIAIDEASTINAELWGILLDAAHSGLMAPRFIVMGDPAQLPPINEGESLAFRHACPSAHLATVQRYDGPVAELADNFRQHLDRAIFPTFTTAFDPETRKGVYACDRPTWEALIKKVFTSDEARRDPDMAKILAYRNVRVDALNVMVRNALGYRTPWVVGERIIALAPYAIPGQMVLSTSDEAAILSIYEITLMGLPCWQLTLDNGGAIPVPKDPAAFKAQLDELKKTKQHGKYWLLKESVADVTYAYALTGHRAQGSTYRYAFVDVADLARCKGMARTVDGDRVYEKNQLAYVAFSRPTERLILNTGK
jgi:hypothetical protein